jgi:hypothetical protein
VSVRDVSLSLDSRATQVIAAAWSGVITTGDTARTTDATGTATFYSSRTRNPGTVKFCVDGVTAGGLDYTPGANLETCDAVTK